jgi:hypothetical protein
MKNGKRAASLTAAEIAELEKGYVGRSFRLVAYEAGGFSGIPSKLPDDIPIWADVSFHFSTSLTILRELGEKPKSMPAKQ